MITSIKTGDPIRIAGLGMTVTVATDGLVMLSARTGHRLISLVHYTADRSGWVGITFEADSAPGQKRKYIRVTGMTSPADALKGLYRALPWLEPAPA